MKDETLSPPKLFEHVATSDGTDDSSRVAQLLQNYRQSNPVAFRRSFAFILSVKRNRRVLLCYNWASNVFKAIVSRLRERNSSLFALTDQSMNLLQRHSLRRLAPRVTTKKAGGKPSVPKTTTTAGISTSATPNFDDNPSPEDISGTKSHRATRPVTIRRPRLIGKSVEGAAMQAVSSKQIVFHAFFLVSQLILILQVAASRARASSKMFRGGVTPTPPTLARKASGDDSNRSLKQGKDRGSVSNLASIPSSVGKQLALTRGEYEGFLSRDSLLRTHSKHQRAMSTLSSKLWPKKNDTQLTPLTLDFILSKSSLVWREVSELPGLPGRMKSSFLTSFAQTLSAWLPNVKFLPVSVDDTSVSNVFLVGETKKTRSSKCQVVLRVGLLEKEKGGKKKTYVTCDAWATHMPRYRRLPNGSKVLKNEYNDTQLFEKDAAGLDKLSTDLHKAISLDKLVFDFLASFAERTMKSYNAFLGYGEVLGLVRLLMRQNSLKNQLRYLQSNYKVYSTPLFFASYGDSLIDMFDARQLFNWLVSHASDRNLMTCTPKSLCFKREIVVRATHTICFLAFDETQPDRLEAVLLCRTQGRDLTEFMFRDGSIYAITILDNIAIEAAGLAFYQLKAAALQINLDSLWTRASATSLTRGPTMDKPKTSEINELLRLSVVTNITDFVTAASLSTLAIEKLRIDWRSCCTLMGQDPSFSPSWDLSEEGDFAMLFYVQSKDSFLLVRVEGGALEAFIVERQEDATSSANGLLLAQFFANFVLHFIWSDIMS